MSEHAPTGKQHTPAPARYTVTAALPYTNGPIHIGHLAGVYVPADIYARFLRSQGRDVAFICGSDEHGVAIPMRARKEGVSPQEIIDRYHGMIEKAFADFGISFDHYSRTSAPVHHKTAQDFFRTLEAKGGFVRETSEQLYDAEADEFLADRFVTGTCPKCGHPEAYGDQCENCGSSLNATDLINPRSTLTGAKPTLRSTTHWYLPLDRHEEFLKEWILEGHRGDWKPNVYGQCKSWIDDGLKPRAVTRDLDWGIPVPVEGGEGKVLYVWFDAPIGYISATQEWAKERGIDWEPYWQDSDTKLVHFIGKDNIVFHCIIFPSMLHAHGDFILPDNVPANEFLNLEGRKLSTSKNWAVWLHEYLEDFEGMEDVLRYALTINAPETKDNDFTWDDFQARNNNELVAVLGNFVNRVVVLTHKYLDGRVPGPGNPGPGSTEALEAIRRAPAEIASSIERYRFREGVQHMMQLARVGNKFLAEAEPWKVVKTDPEAVPGILHTALQVTAALAVVCEPFLPHTAKKLARMLAFDRLEDGLPAWEALQDPSGILPEGHTIGTAEHLFRRIEDAEIEAQRQRLAQSATDTAQANAVEAQKDTIAFEDFGKLDMRVGTVVKAEKMPKAKKLLVLEVDTGLDRRTIVSGIAEHFEPDDLVGKQVTVLVNLAPRKLRGVDSEGMILMAEDPEGGLVFINPDGGAMAPGSTIS